MPASRSRAILAIALLTAPSLFAVQEAPASEQYMFVSTRHVPDSQVDSLVQGATRACDLAGRQAYKTRAFKTCMLRLGWRYSRVSRFAGHRRLQHDADLDKRNEDESNWAQQRREEQQRNDESNANLMQSIQNQPVNPINPP